MSSNAVETKEESNLGLEKARVWEIKSNAIFVLIRLGITSIGLSLYIYRLGKTYPFMSKITWGLFTKTLILLRLHRPDRSDRSASELPELAVNNNHQYLAKIVLIDTTAAGYTWISANMDLILYIMIVISSHTSSEIHKLGTRVISMPILAPVFFSLSTYLL